mmetsp:Transcript_26547/g.61999  ORF Transcript_26547/g.61999 Transcript_26547/m.61999 type:complete len:240 (+) Transcript_26547:727-1446(+)
MLWLEVDARPVHTNEPGLYLQVWGLPLNLRLAGVHPHSLLVLEVHPSYRSIPGPCGSNTPQEAYKKASAVEEAPSGLLIHPTSHYLLLRRILFRADARRRCTFSLRGNLKQDLDHSAMSCFTSQLERRTIRLVTTPGCLAESVMESLFVGFCTYLYESLDNSGMPADASAMQRRSPIRALQQHCLRSFAACLLEKLLHNVRVTFYAGQVQWCARMLVSLQHRLQCKPMPCRFELQSSLL